MQERYLKIEHITEASFEILSGAWRSRTRLATGDGLEIDFKRAPQLRQAREQGRETPILLLISGRSESGKSHMGKRFVRDNAGNRLKIYKTVREGIEFGRLVPYPLPTNDLSQPFQYCNWAGGNHDAGQKLIDYIVSQYCQIADSTGVHVAVVETIKHPWIIEALREDKKVRSVSIFIDAPEDLRIRREAAKKHIAISEMAQTVKDKDKIKAGYGNDQIMGLCDVLISNAGTLESYESFILFLERYTKRYCHFDHDAVAKDFSL